MIVAFEKTARKLKKERLTKPLEKLKVTVPGQQGLLIRRESLPGLTLIATNDFDGHLNGEPPLENVFKRSLRDDGLAYDKDSPYIWLPEETEHEVVYNSEFMIIDSPLPKYLLVSKAKYAPEKNRQLIVDAIIDLGDEFLALMEKHGVDIGSFIEE